MLKTGVCKGIFTLIFFNLILPNYGTKQDACESYCLTTSNARPSSYLPGSTYQYRFNSDVEIYLGSKQYHQTKTSVKADVYIIPTSACSHLLRLQNFEIFGEDSKKYTGITEIDRPISFKIENGVLNDHICTDPNDTPNSLNVKRAIASLFHIDTTKKYQTDIFGSCPTILKTYEKTEDKIVIKRTRNLNKCAYREHMHDDFMLSTFNEDNNVKAVPLLDSDYKSVQTLLSDGILENGQIIENYTYYDFTTYKTSSTRAAANIIVATSLTYVGFERSASVPNTSNQAKSIIFDNPRPITTEKTDKNEVFELIQKLSQQSNSVLSEYSARYYKNLIKILRDAKKADLHQYYNEIKDDDTLKTKDIARRIFLDALFHCGTSNAVVVGVELLKHNELDKKEEKLLFVSFAFVKHPTLSAVEAAADLVQNYDVPREAYLGIGNLAGRYCRQVACQTEAMDKLTDRFLNKLTHPLVFTRGEENDMIYVLKALSNIPQLNDRTVKKIASFIKNKVYPSRLRVAALETLSSNACNSQIQNYAYNVLRDNLDDTELRIKAYLLLVKCPNNIIVELINTILKFEKSYQVGAFITSHVRAMTLSTNSANKFVKYYLSKIQLKNDFPYNPLKYSYSGEHSGSMDYHDGRIFTEANLIYSQNSFLPRSANLNLTGEVFGHNVNFFELGIRQQNLDRLVEHYFGPLGVFNKATSKDESQTGQNALQKIMNYFNSRFEKTRHKRDVSKTQIEKFGKELHTNKNELNNEVDLDFSIKLFGSELLFLSLADDTEKLSPESIIDRFFDSYEETAKESSDFEKSYYSRSFFLDAHLNYPTSSGFPLKMGIEGTSLIQVKTKGNVDLKKLLMGSNDMGLLRLSIIPSATIEVTSKITLDTQIVERGLNLVANLNTATGGEFNIDLSDINKGIDFKYSFPVENQNIVSASFEVIFNSREIGHVETNQQINFDRPDSNFTFEEIGLIPDTGLDPYLTFKESHDKDRSEPHGKYSVILGVRNVDFSHFHFKWTDNLNDKGEVETRYIAEILDKKQQQKGSALLEISKNNVKTQFKTTVFNALAELKKISTETEESIQAEVAINGKREFIKIGVIVKESSADATRLSPILEHTAGGLFGYYAPSVHLAGDVIIETVKNTKITFENTRVTVSQYGNNQTYTVNGNFGEKEGTYFCDLVLTDDHNILKIYEKIKLLDDYIDFEGRLENNIYPEYNMHVIYQYKELPVETRSFLEITHGDDLKSQENRLTVMNYIAWKRDPEYSFETLHKITYPALNLLMKAEVVDTAESLFYDIEYKYNKYLLGSNMDLKFKENNICNYNMKFKAYDSKNMIAAKSKCDLESSKYHIVNTVSINNDIYDLSGLINCQIGKYSIDFSSDLELKIPHLLKYPIRIQEQYKYGTIMFKVSDSQTEYYNLHLYMIGSNPLIGLKFYIKDYIDIKGNVFDTDGNGNSDLSIEYLPLHHLIKVEATHMSNNSNFNVVMKIYPEYNRNPAEYVTLTSDSHFSRYHINSVNELDVHGKKYKLTYLRLERSMEFGSTYTNTISFAKPDNIELSMEYDYIDYSFNLPGNWNGQHSFKIIDHNLITDWQDAELFADLTFKNFNENNCDGKFIFKSSLGHENKKYHFSLSNDKITTDEEFTEEFAFKLYKDTEENGIVFKGKTSETESSELNELYMSYNFKKILIDLKEAIHYNSRKAGPLIIDFNFEGKYPYYRLSHVKFNTYTEIDQEGGPYEFLSFSTKNGLFLRKDAYEKKTLLDLKVDADVKFALPNGFTKISVNSKDLHPITVDFNYHLNDTPKDTSLNSNITVVYGINEQVMSDIIIEKINREYTTKFNFYHSRHFPIHVESILKELTPDRVHHELTVVVDKERYQVIDEFEITSKQATFDLKIIYPNRETDTAKFSADLTKRDRAVWLSSIHFHELIKFHLENKIDLMFKDLENFEGYLELDCPELKIKYFTFYLGNKPLTLQTSTVNKDPSQPLTATQAQNGGQLVLLEISQDGKRSLSAKSHYQLRQKQTEDILEGSGHITLGSDKPIKHNYQLKHDNRFVDKFSSIGESYALNLKIEHIDIDAELKYTQGVLEVLSKYCEPRFPCVLIKMDADYEDNYFNQAMVVDLRYFAGPEIVLNDNYTLGNDGFKGQSELILNGVKYVFKLDSLENKFVTELTTPHRTMSLEGFMRPSPYKNPVNIHSTYDLHYYADKSRHPNQRTSLYVTYKYKEEKISEKTKFEVILQDPRLSKDLRISYSGEHSFVKFYDHEHIELDIFNEKNNAINLISNFNGKILSKEGVKQQALYQVQSTGLKIDFKYEENVFLRVKGYQEFTHDTLLKLKLGEADYDSSVSLKVNKELAEYDVKFFNKELFYISMKPSISPLVLHSNLRIMSVTPFTARFKILDNRAKLIVKFEDKPDEGLEFIVNFDEKFNLECQYTQSDQIHIILAISIYLNNNNQLQHAYLYDDQKEDRYIIQPIKKYYTKLYQEMKMIELRAENDIYEQFLSVVKKLEEAVNVKPLIDFYSNSWKEFVQELSTDKVLVNIWNSVYYSVLIPVDRYYTNNIHPNINKFLRSLRRFEYQCERELRYLINNMVHITNRTIRILSETFADVYKKIALFTDTPPGSEIVEYLEKIIVYGIKFVNMVEKKLILLFKDVEAVKVFEQLDEMLNLAITGGTVSEDYIRSFQDVMKTLNSVTDSESLKKLITLTTDYITQKLRGLPVNDVAALDEIYEALIEFFIEIYNTPENRRPFSNYDYWVVEYVFKDMWLRFADEINRFLSFLDEYKLPKQFDAAIAYGDHFFTFDGKAISFRENCDYVLAQDAVNQNFSIVGSFQSGWLSSITFADKSDIVTLNTDGVVKLNNAVKELPIRKEHRLEVFEDYEGITILSKAGVRMVCDRKLLVCSFHVSGYYHAQLRGLLGNANHDPFDDFTSVNGFVQTNSNTFVSSYGINKQCEPAVPIAYRGPNRKCSRLFMDRASSLWPCFSTVNPKPFKLACDKAMSIGTEEVLSGLTTAYVKICKAKKIEVEVPRRLVQCTNYVSPKKVAETFKITTPGKAADIVFLVDQDIKNKGVFTELLQPLVDQLTNSFKKENIDDVDYHFIGYGGEYEKRPYHYRVEGKMVYKNGQIPNIQFSEPLSESNKETFMEYINRLAKEVDLITGQDMLSTAYFEAIKYPFRAHAVKSIIVFNSKSCDNNYLEYLHSLANSLLVDKLYTVNLFTTIPQTNAKQSTNTDIIGFNQKAVYKFSNIDGARLYYKAPYENVCTKFALKNRGNVFIVNNFKENSQNKEVFIKTSARAIVKELVNVEQGLKCTCDMITPYSGQNVCKVQYTRSLA